MYVKNNKLSHHSKYMCGMHANRKIYKAHILFYIPTPTYYNYMQCIKLQKCNLYEQLLLVMRALSNRFVFVCVCVCAKSEYVRLHRSGRNTHTQFKL